MQDNSSPVTGPQINDFPDEISLRILALLKPRDLFASSRVCRDWQSLMDDLEIWKYYNEPIKSTWPYAIKVENMTNRAYYKKYFAGDRIRDIYVFNDHIYGACEQELLIWRPKNDQKYAVTRHQTDHHDVITKIFLYVHPQTMQTTMLTGSADWNVKIWSLQQDATFKLMHTLKGHESNITSLMMCDKRIFTGSVDSTIKVWEVGKETVNCVSTLNAHDGPITCFQVETKSANELTLYSGSSKTIKVWDINFETKKCENTHTLENVEGGVTCLSFNHTFSRGLIAGFMNGTIKIIKYNLKKVLESRVIQTNQEPVSCLLKPFFKKQFFSGSQNKMKVWEANSQPAEGWTPSKTQQETAVIATVAIDMKFNREAASKLYMLTHQNSIKIFRLNSEKVYELTHTLHSEEEK